MKAIKKLIISLVVIVAILAVTIIGGYIHIRTTYGIDLFRTAGQLKILAKEVDETTLCLNAFDDKDFIEMKDEVDKKIDGLVLYEANKGYKGYSMNFSSLSGKSMDGRVISFTEKQVGALAQIVFYEQTGGKVKLGEKEVEVKIIQVNFSEIGENGSANFDVTTKIDLTPFKADMEKFPYKYFKKYIPDSFYVSSTVRIEKEEKEKFNYQIEHKFLALNYLSPEDTTDLFSTLNTILKIGTAKDINIKIGSVAVNALIGNEENPGFAYSLKAIGATTFNFGIVTNTNWFVVY